MENLTHDTSKISYEVDTVELDYFREWLGIQKVELAKSIDMSVIMYHKLLADKRELSERFTDELWINWREALRDFKLGLPNTKYGIKSGKDDEVQ